MELDMVHPEKATPDGFSMVSSGSSRHSVGDKSTDSTDLIIEEKEKEEEALMKSPEDDEVEQAMRGGIPKVSMGRVCAGLLGELEARTCANPHAAADEVRFFKKRNRHPDTAFRVRPRTPVRQIAKRNRLDALHASTDEFKKNVDKYTKILSPVCGDDTLARILMTGYDYDSPMSRAIPVPVFALDDDVKDDELQSEVCNGCIFCERELVRHHKTRENENPIIRQLRSPCRCFHECMADEKPDADEDEPGGKKYIMDRFLRDKGHIRDDPECKLEDESKANKLEDKDVTPLSHSEINDDRDELIITPRQVESEKVEPIADDIQILVCETDTPTRPPIQTLSDIRKRSACHSELQLLPAKRVSVITPNAASETSSLITSTTGTSSHLLSGTYQPIRPRSITHGLVVDPNKVQTQQIFANRANFKPQVSYQASNPSIQSADSVIKIENPSSLEAYGMYAYRNSVSSTSSRSNYTLPGNGQESRNFYMGTPRPHRAEPVPNMAHYAVQPHQQQVYTQEDVNRMLTPGHPPRIRACVERLAQRFSVSRSRPEHNEKQVTELLQLACEVRRDEECETFYCTWKDCIKHFNRRDSLVRHLRVHVNVRPFKCERCDQRFLRSDHLRVHMLRHTGEQPFACIVCGLTFGRKDLRNRHMKTIHYREERPPQRVLDLLEGADWDAIEIDADMLRKN